MTKPNSREIRTAVDASDLSAREMEMKRLEAAISKTEASQVRAMQMLDALYEKKCRQMAELRFQKMLLGFEKQRVEIPNKQT